MGRLWPMWTGHCHARALPFPASSTHLSSAPRAVILFFHPLDLRHASQADSETALELAQALASAALDHLGATRTSHRAASTRLRNHASDYHQQMCLRGFDNLVRPSETMLAARATHTALDATATVAQRVRAPCRRLRRKPSYGPPSIPPEPSGDTGSHSYSLPLSLRSCVKKMSSPPSTTRRS